MAEITYRANLKVTSFPMLSEQHGRSVIIKSADQNYVAGLATKEATDSSLGVPQLFYAHNVVPADTGYQSVGYWQFTNNGDLPGDSDFSAVILIRDGSGNAAHIAYTTSGRLYILTALSGKWEAVTGAPAPATIAGKRLTVALVSGTSYIYIANIGCYVYDFVTATMASVALAGLTATEILGVIGAFGYMIAYSKDAVAWSSTISATDFVPSLETGAGGGSVESAKGTIKSIESVHGALIIFTETNAVAAIFSGNLRYPFTFSEVVGCGGLSDANYVSYDTGAGALYAYTTSGLQTVNAKSAITVFPEVTDLLSGNYFEDFDEATNTLSTLITTGVIQKRLAVITDRYLIISYGVGAVLTHAIIYDTALKQFGRLKVPHVDCFEFQLYDQSALETPKKSIGFLQSNGTIKLVNFDISQPSHTGVALFGRFQYARSRFIQLASVEVESVAQGATFSCYDIPTLDGKTFLTPIAGYLMTTAAKLRKYLFHNTAMNHSVLCKGQFQLSTLILSFTVTGAR